jgi:hypothetical protein
VAGEPPSHKTLELATLSPVWYFAEGDNAYSAPSVEAFNDVVVLKSRAPISNGLSTTTGSMCCRCKRRDHCESKGSSGCPVIPEPEATECVGPRH